jgi:hypothetical protein
MKNLGHVSVALLRRPPPEGAEATGSAGQEVRTRPVIDRIVSDKTFWNATFSRSFLKKIFRDLRSQRAQRLRSVRTVRNKRSEPLAVLASDAPAVHYV